MTALDRIVRVGLVVALVELVVAVGLMGQTPRPQCTDPGWYQRTCDGNWNFAIAGNKTGDVFYGCAAHTLVIFGADGGQYAILDQCYPEQHCSGTQGTYRKPDDPVALAKWAYYYTDPDAEAHRHAFSYWNDTFQIPNGVQHYNYLTLARVPDPPRVQLGALYGCNPAPTNPPTRTATKTPAGGLPTRTPTNAPTPDPCAVVPGGCTPAPTRTLPIGRTATPTPRPERWKVYVIWTKPDGSTGMGQVVTRNGDSTDFWFFSPGNTELIVKTLDGCSVNGYRWFFAAGLTNVAVTITVTDTLTGASKSYGNPQGQAFKPIQDTQFEPCGAP